MMRPVCDAYRHPGVLPAYPFYGGPPVKPDIRARASCSPATSHGAITLGSSPGCGPRPATGNSRT